MSFINNLKTSDPLTIEDQMNENPIEVQELMGRVDDCIYLGDDSFLVKSTKTGESQQIKFYTREELIAIVSAYQIRQENSLPYQPKP